MTDATCVVLLHTNVWSAHPLCNCHIRIAILLFRGNGMSTHRQLSSACQSSYGTEPKIKRKDASTGRQRLPGYLPCSRGTAVFSDQSISITCQSIAKSTVFRRQGALSDRGWKSSGERTTVGKKNRVGRKNGCWHAV
jgi:hypothetical protein